MGSTRRDPRASRCSIQTPSVWSSFSMKAGASISVSSFASGAESTYATPAV
jgi:hypothetical protein